MVTSLTCPQARKTCKPDSEAASVMIVDDHGVVRDGLELILNNEPDIHVIGKSANADEAMELALVLQPDIMLTDVDMPGRSCFDVIRVLRPQLPATRFVLFSAHLHDSYIEDALRVRVDGFIDKAEGRQGILAALRRVHAGETYYSDRVSERLVFADGSVRLASGASTRLGLLSPRERELLRLVARGEALKTAARVLGISYKTADAQKACIMAKLDIHDRVELAHFAIREGLISV